MRFNPSVYPGCARAASTPAFGKNAFGVQENHIRLEDGSTFGVQESRNMAYISNSEYFLYPLFDPIHKRLLVIY